jgi:hypothetical protein
MNLAFAVRVLSKDHSPENEALLQRIYEQRTSTMVRRDIILTMARWGVWFWLSDLRNRYRELSDTEKRAFIIASYTLRDEGRHWRRHIRRELSEFELLVKAWTSDKVRNNPDWVVPV